MSTIYKASFVSLHVRKSNKPAIALYRDALGFHVAKVEQKYCTLSTHFLSRGCIFMFVCADGDGEDALSMRLDL